MFLIKKKFSFCSKATLSSRVLKHSVNIFYKISEFTFDNFKLKAMLIILDDKHSISLL